MSAPLSPNTQAILLLTAPLLVGRSEPSRELLTGREYKTLVRRLRELQRQPSDLLQADSDDLLDECGRVIERSRLEKLLARGFLLGQATERWHSRAIWVVSRADPAYPRRFKTRLKEDAPPIVYGCGDHRLLEQGGLAIVGSRRADESLLEYTRGVSRTVAQARRLVISGGARGIDQAAVEGAVDEGGRAIAVLADSLERAAVQRDNRDRLLDGRLVLISPYDPAAGFNVGHAMQRNKLVYALADAALVVNSDLNKGGTWAGATEQLDELRFVPLFVRSTGAGNAAIEALVKKGARPWPDPSPNALDQLLRTEPPRTDATAGLRQLSLDSHEATLTIRDSAATAAASDPAMVRAESRPADALFVKVRELVLPLLVRPNTAAAISDALAVSLPQATAWLERLVTEGAVERREEPLQYVARASGTNRDPPATHAG